MKKLKDKCRNACSKSKGSGAGGDLVGTVDSDDTRSGRRGDWNNGRSSSSATSSTALKRCSGTTTKSRGTRNDGGRRRNTSNRRHNNTAGVREGRNTGAEGRKGDREARVIDTGQRNTVAGNRSRSGLSARHVGRMSASDDDWSRRGHTDGTGTSWKNVSLARFCHGQREDEVFLTQSNSGL